MTVLPLTELLEKWRLAGVQLRAEGDKLVVVGRKGVLTPEIANEIRLRKSELLEFLGGGAAAVSTSGDGHSVAGSVVPLNSSGTNLPVFFICGIQLYQPLANALGDDQPSFGVFVPAEVLAVAAGSTEAVIQVHSLASEYLSAIRRHQPKGPYCLAGVSFGGVLAFEIAHQLTALGEDVGLLALFDSVLARGLSFDAPSWVKGKFKQLTTKSPWEVIEQRIRRNEAQAVATNTGEDASVDKLGAVRDRLYAQAMNEYGPQMRPWPGRAVLYRALDQKAYVGYNVGHDCGWGGMLEAGLDVYDVPGDHIGILAEPYVAELATTLRRHLNEASSTHHRSGSVHE